MKRKVILTCAVTGGTPITPNSKYVPITPEQIANEAISAAQAGAASVHLHVRDPQTGEPSMGMAYYQEVVERVRAADTGVIINLTMGMGASYIPADNRGEPPVSVVHPPAERVAHVVALRPDICTLDVATMNFGDVAMVNTAAHLKMMAAAVRQVGVKPELEVFDLGHIELALRLIKDGHIEAPAFFQFCLGIPGGAPASSEVLQVMKSLLPAQHVWSAFGIGRSQMTIVAQSVILGGHCRVGLEDNLFLEHGVLAPGNRVLVDRAAQIIRDLGAELATPDEARIILGMA
ncbi:beta-keto acid cleavage family enzyme [Devosia sp. A369]